MQEGLSIFLPPKLKEYAAFKKGNIGLNLKENILACFKNEGLSISEQTIDSYVNTVIKDFQEINANDLLREEGS
ncbi:hypothetical protein KKG71_02320 [Patescibacteria group bacterium]|nr:hypothetical protein [Patescibacteria group bacterium]